MTKNANNRKNRLPSQWVVMIEDIIIPQTEYEDGYNLKKEALLSDLVLEFSAALAEFNSKFRENSNSHVEI